MARVVGIDLGSSYTRVAVLGQGVILDRGSVTPSIIAEDPTGRLMVGGRARVLVGNTSTFRRAKQSLGSAEEVIALLIRHVKEITARELDEPIDEAVVAVPARFSASARAAMVRAGAIAGLRIVETVPEPVATMLAHFADDDRDPLRALVYDFGGGKFDATVLERRGGTINVVSTAGDPFLGGADLDERLTEWIVDQLRAQGHEVGEASPENVGGGSRGRLLRLAERAKLDLQRRDVRDCRRIRGCRLGRRRADLISVGDQPNTIRGTDRELCGPNRRDLAARAGRPRPPRGGAGARRDRDDRRVFTYPDGGSTTHRSPGSQSVRPRRPDRTRETASYGVRVLRSARKLLPISTSSGMFCRCAPVSGGNAEWVEREWRCALTTRGLEYIDPVPLVSPDIVPPPAELSELHFNDWMLAFTRSR